MKKLYVVLIKAHTGLGAVARTITGYPYTHIAVSLDPSMTDFVSFSRRYHSFPFEAGITHEFRHYYAFGSHKDFRAKIFELPLTDDRYYDVLRYIVDCELDTDMVFNLFSMATMPIIGGFRIPHADNCMSFTAKCIELSGSVEMKRPYWRYSIKDIDELLTDYRFFEGRLLRGDAPDDGYMKPFEPIRYFRGMASLFGNLTVRLIKNSISR